MQTSTYNETATTSCQLRIACLTASHIGLEQSANPQLLHEVEEHIMEALIITVTLIILKIKNSHKYTHANISSSDNNTRTNNTKTTIVSFTWWFLIPRVSVKASRAFVVR